jgi:hypothetical protein
VRKIIRTSLARTTDPVTSHASAHEIDHKFKPHHAHVIEWLSQNGPATDDHVASAMVELGVAKKHEQARRWVRTCREWYGLIVPAIGQDGQQLQMQNESGRMALAWKAAQ